MVYDRARLKQDVKLSMKSTRPNPMLVTLLFSFVVSAGTWLINQVLGWLLTGGVGSITDTVWYYMAQGYDVEYAVQTAMLELFRLGFGAIFGAVVGGTLLSLIISLWQSTMDVGYEGWCLSMVRGENPPMGKIFSALSQFGEVLVTRILTGIFEVLWALLLVLGYIVIGFAVTALAVAIDSELLMFLFLVPATVALMLGMIWVTMRYALVDYVLLDKGLSGMDAIRESKRLMKGNIGKGFVLQLSFFGWYLLLIVMAYAGILAAFGIVMSQLSNSSGLVAASGIALLILAAVGIGTTVLMLWLQPYINGSWARFYDWACGRPASSGGGSGWGGGDRGWNGHTDYTWTTGPSSGTGIGGSWGNGNPPPKPPKSPRDDPWN